MGDLQFGRFGALEGRESRLSKVHTRLPNTCQYDVLLYLPPFGWNSNVKLWTPVRLPPPVWTVGVVPGDRKWYQLKCPPYIPIRLLYAYLEPFGHNTQHDRQTTNKAIGIGRLCHSIGGIKANKFLLLWLCRHMTS